MADLVVAADVPTAHPLVPVYEQSFNTLKSTIICNICVRPMYEPYTIHCGHTFCYSCLVAWFEKNIDQETCPECRTKVTQRPAPSFTIREMARLLFSQPELIADDEYPEDYARIREEERQIVESHRAGNRGDAGLFPGSFTRPRMSRIRDLSDRVDRCPTCTWELEGGWCLHCERSWEDSDISGRSTPLGYRTDDLSDSDSFPDTETWDDAHPWPTGDQLGHPLHLTMSEYEDLYDEEYDSDVTSLDGFIDNDEAQEGHVDDNLSIPSGSPRSPSVVYLDGPGPIWDDDNPEEANLNAQSSSNDDSSDDSITTQDAEHFYDREHSVELGGDSDSHLSSEGNPAETFGAEEWPQSSSEDSSGDDENNIAAAPVDMDAETETDTVYEVEPTHDPTVNLTIPRQSENRRKRHRVVESDSEDEDEDLPATQPRSRRRLNHAQRRIRSDDESETGNVSESSTLGRVSSTHENVPTRRRVVSGNNCRNTNIRHENQPPLHNSSRRRNQRPIMQASHSGNSTRPQQRAFGQNQIATVPPLPTFDENANAHRYNDFVIAWDFGARLRGSGGFYGFHN